MCEEKRLNILKQYLPQRYIDIYFYVLYRDPIYLPDDLKRDNKTRPVKNVDLNKEIANLSLLLARALIKNEVIEWIEY